MNFLPKTGVITYFNGIKRMRWRSYCFCAANSYLQQSPTVSVKAFVFETPRYYICSRSFSSNTLNTLTNIPMDVKHDTESRRFYIDVKDVGCAYLQYDRKDQLIKLMHTEVPDDLGGRGIGKILAKEALEYVAKNDFQLEIHCDFVRNYVSKHAPKYIKYLVA